MGRIIMNLVIRIIKRVRDKGIFYKPDYVSSEWMRDHHAHPNRNENPYIIK